MRKPILLGTALLLVLGVGVGGYWIGLTMSQGHTTEHSQSQSVVGGSPDQAPPKPLELPMYDLLDQPELKVPMAKLGETVEVGPVRVTVTLSDGFYWPDENAKAHMMGVYGFLVRIQNGGDGVLELNPKTAYWIAEDEQLRTRTFDPRINWYVMAPGDRRRLGIPDPKFLHEELGVRGTEVYYAFWARDKKKWTPLPREIGPGETAEGWIYFDMMNPPGFENPYYLFFGSWPSGKAWGGFVMPSYPDLYAMLLDVGTTSSVVWEMPWGDPDMIMNKPEWLEPVVTPPPPPEVLEQEGEGKGSR